MRCGNSLAVIFCHNCARFDGGCGRFCKSCFQVYHPWYRMAHKWSPIGLHPDEPSEELHRQAYRANVGRNIADIQELLQKTSMWKNELRVQDADTKKVKLIVRKLGSGNRRSKFYHSFDLVFETIYLYGNLRYISSLK